MSDLFRRRRRDALPEHTSYADGGCELYSACLSCPLDQCQFDGAGGASGVRRRKRNEELILAASQDGIGPGDLATMFGLSRRTVFRVLRQQRGDY